MLTRGLVVLALLFGVLSMHQVAAPVHAASTVEMSVVDPHHAPADHEERDGGLHLCLGLVITAFGLLALRLTRGGVLPVTTAAERAPVVCRPRERSPAWRAPDLSRLCVLRL
ncbi:hypothetical protein ACFFQW_08470 [Umezawaea endophytica]|uniref:Uncharacterized protein n=1 Tax=Umezawaea endophytica TaxID=1654476 RepID=A0A9X2VH45_9PSEU|nr:hypothetical protein [Umezawaea endophytica]MCS7476019.1 hypothetical protein [Umezawaea endophytica]